MSIADNLRQEGWEKGLEQDVMQEKYAISMEAGQCNIPQYLKFSLWMQ